MKIISRLLNNNLVIFGSLGFFCYTALSWVLLFRDPRALIAIGNFYPTLEPFLSNTQVFFVHHGLNTIATILFILVSSYLIYIYVKVLKRKITLKTAIFGGVLFQVIVFFSYPILATDIFSYMMSNRVV